MLAARAVDGLAAELGSTPAVERTLADLADRACLQVLVEDVRLVVKVDTDLERSRREVAALGAARRAGVRVPRVVWHREGIPAVLALEHLDGVPLGESAGGWRAAGAAARLLHGMPAGVGWRRFDHRAESWRQFLLWWTDHEAARCAEMGALGSAEAAQMRHALRSRIEEMDEPRRTVLHGDLQPEHVLCLPGKQEVALLDWGDAGTGDPLWDLAVLLLDHRHRLPAVLAGYRPDQSTQAHIAEQLDTYRLLRYLGEITWLLARGFDAGASIAGARAVLAG